MRLYAPSPVLEAIKREIEVGVREHVHYQSWIERNREHVLFAHVDGRSIGADECDECSPGWRDPPKDPHRWQRCVRRWEAKHVSRG